MIKLEEYLRLCNTTSLIKNQSFKKITNPKFSIITPNLNKCRTIQRYIKSIQYQTFKNIEIIIIDDHSTDDTIKIIEKLKKQDERIILLKNKQRKGTLITKNIGVNKSKGEYLLFVDPDDIISENILNYFDKITKKYDYDLIRYNLYIGDYDVNLPYIVYFLKRKPLYKPNIFFHLFYGFGKLFQLDFYITNKLEHYIQLINII